MISTVYIAKNVYGGDGLGRLGDGRAVFVSGAFAGENIRAELTEEKRHFVRAKLVEVVEASPERIGEGLPPAPGMVYANLSRAGELVAKAAQLKEFLERSRLVSDSFVDFDSMLGPDLNYRNKSVYHFAKRGGDYVFGYHEMRTNRIVALEKDPLALPKINAALPEIFRAAKSLLTQGAKSVRRAVAEEGKLTVRYSECSGIKWWLGEAPADLVIKEQTAGLGFEVPAGGFYQVNPAVGDALVRRVVDLVAADSGLTSLIDLYCGVGVFGIAVLRRFKALGRMVPSLLGVESGHQAVEFARRNANAQGLLEAKFIAGETARNLNRIRIKRTSTVIVDPPRGGMERALIAHLCRYPAARIFYVSCDPATLVRDLRELASVYRIRRVELFDMFPRTARFETLVELGCSKMPLGALT